MVIKPIGTKPITVGDHLNRIFDNHLPTLEEHNILVVTSKIVSICEGAIVKNDESVDKHKLIIQESDSYLDLPISQTYGVAITIKNNNLVANAGIDESNGNGYYILWPRNPFQSASSIWKYLRKKHNIKRLGIIITDSHIIPLQWGTRGRALAWCGFEPLKNYIGTSDIFGRNLHMTNASIADGLAAAAVTVMGEGNEQTPLAIINGTPFVRFVGLPPTKEEINSLTINLKDDMYAPLLTSVQWVKSRK